MLLLTSPELRQAERWAAQHLPGPGLMSLAGQAAAEVALKRFRGPYLVLAGPGNNGGDAMETALRLQQAWQTVSVVLLAEPSQLPADARQAYERCREAGLHFLPTLPDTLSAFACVIDGLFGIGLKRPLEKNLVRWVLTLQKSSLPVLALDVPSGLNADTGRVVGGTSGVAVKATQTLTFIAGKPGLWTAQGPDYCGEVQVADLGVSVPWEQQHPRSGQLNTPALFRPVLKPRTHDSHKGSFGNVHIVGGQTSMAGAALLSGRAALFCGAGRVYVHSLAGLTLDPLFPELMLRDATNNPQPQGVGQGTIVCGPGLGMSDTAEAWLEHCIQTPQPLILDADALNLLARHPAGKKQLQRRTEPTVLTPHPLEAARLLQEPVDEVNADRLRAVRELAALYGALVVLKGAGSFIASPETKGIAPAWLLNPSGNPGLASPGTGDVLSGVIAALIASAPSETGNRPQTAHEQAFWCTSAAVWLHGRAADDLTSEPQHGGTKGLTASELLPALRRLLNQWTNGLEQS